MKKRSLRMETTVTSLRVLRRLLACLPVRKQLQAWQHARRRNAHACGCVSVHMCQCLHVPASQAPYNFCCAGCLLVFCATISSLQSKGLCSKVFLEKENCFSVQKGVLPICVKKWWFSVQKGVLLICVKKCYVSVQNCSVHGRNPLNGSNIHVRICTQYVLDMHTLRMLICLFLR
jgi:hypothetical protein